jgi:hypothetical protein
VSLVPTCIIPIAPSSAPSCWLVTCVDPLVVFMIVWRGVMS